MCVTVFERNSVKYILAGFEDGKVSSWDIRSPQQELSTIEFFSEPGMYVYMQLLGCIMYLKATYLRAY